MEKTAQASITKNANGLELSILNIDSISITHHIRNDYGDMDDLLKSMQKDGMQDPLLVNEIEPGKYVIIDGVRRITAATDMGWKQIPCLIKKGIPEADAAHLSWVKNHERKSLSPIEEARHLLRMKEEFNFTNEELYVKGYGSSARICQTLKLLGLAKPVQAMIDKKELTKEHGIHLSNLSTAKEQERMAKKVEDFNWSAKQTGLKVSRYLKKDNKIKRKLPVSIIPDGDVPGVYFKDSSDMSELPDESVQLIVTSPNYHVGMEFEKGYSYDEHWENIKLVMAETARVLVPGGIMAVNVGNINNFKGAKGNNKFTQIQLVGHKYQSILRSHGLYLTDQIAWIKSDYANGPDASKGLSEDTPHTGYRMVDNHDPVYIYRKKGNREVPSAEIALKSIITKAEWSRWGSGVWKISRKWKMEGHPSIWPDELPERLIKLYSYEGDTVLDPFLGSGTTIRVARELGREGIGYERLPQYKEVIMRTLGGKEKAPAPAKTMTESIKQILDTPKHGKDELVEKQSISSKLISKKTADGAHFFGRLSSETAEYAETAMPV